ncbi:MAG: hypothetical protein IJD85_04485 [Oscillospiraceae bacterium]|nr:hypothetical protein [Oscillospiraceae bacterium]
MKLRRIMSAMLAAALATSTVAFAEDIATESELDINLTVENSKGTYTFTDEELAAFVDYNIEVNGYGEGTNFTNNPMDIFGEDSSFTVADGKSFSLNEVYQVDFEFIDIQIDADGNTTFKQLHNNVWATGPVASATAIWGPSSNEEDDVKNTFTDITLTASELIECIDDETGWGNDWLHEKYFTYADIDMVIIYFRTSDSFDEDGYVLNPWVWDSETNETVLRPGCSSHFYGKWLVTEQGAAMLNEANAGTTVPEASDDTTSDESGSGDGADTSADDETASGDNDTSTDNAGSTEGADGEDKNSADTGAQGVAVAAGIALAAGAAVLFSRKRK